MSDTQSKNTASNSNAISIISDLKPDGISTSPKNDLLSSQLTNERRLSSSITSKPQLPLPPITQIRRKRRKQK